MTERQNMADGRPTQSSGSQSSRPRRGLGNGLGSLIPDAPPSSRTEGARPLDVLFPDSASAQGSRMRGGSARELLQPRRSGGSRKSVSRETFQASPERPASTVANIGTDTPVTSAPTDAGKPVAATHKRSRPRRNALAGDAVTESPSSPSGREETRPAGAVAMSAAAHSNVSRETFTAVNGEEDPTSREDSPSTTAKSANRPQRATSAALDAIMGTTQNVSRETSEDDPELLAVPGASFGVLRLEEIIPNSRQPREVFDEDELAELAASITEVGVLQPIVVRPIKATDEPTEALRALLETKPEARYELIMGERRLRASELAGNVTVPAIIRETDDDDLLRDALLENLHRVQLNPLEEASAYQQLMADFGATQEELAKRIARSRPQIANTLRLLKLPPSVQRKLAAGSISAGHARALLGLQTSEDMERLAERIVAEGLSVRTTEELVRLGLPRHTVSQKKPREKTLSALGEKLVSALSDAYDTRVTISEGRRKGKIVIEFAGQEDLERIAALLIKE